MTLKVEVDKERSASPANQLHWQEGHITFVRLRLVFMSTLLPSCFSNNFFMEPCYLNRVIFINRVIFTHSKCLFALLMLLLHPDHQDQHPEL